MNEPHDDNRTVDVPSTPADSLDAGLVAGFGRAEPRSSLGDMRPVLLKEAEGESAHVVKPKTDAMPAPAEAGDRYQLSGEIARGGMGAVLRRRDVDLGRDLAIKVLLEKYTDRPEVARRFIEEAQSLRFVGRRNGLVAQQRTDQVTQSLDRFRRNRDGAFCFGALRSQLKIVQRFG